MAERMPPLRSLVYWDIALGAIPLGLSFLFAFLLPAGVIMVLVGLFRGRTSGIESGIIVAAAVLAWLVFVGFGESSFAKSILQLGGVMLLAALLGGKFSRILRNE